MESRKNTERATHFDLFWSVTRCTTYIHNFLSKPINLWQAPKTWESFTSEWLQIFSVEICHHFEGRRTWPRCQMRNLMIPLFWDVRWRQWVIECQHFEETWRSHLQGWIGPKVFFEIRLPLPQGHIQEQQNLQLYRCGNFKICNQKPHSPHSYPLLRHRLTLKWNWWKKGGNAINTKLDKRTGNEETISESQT